MVDFLSSPGQLVCCDYSGVVERVGSAVRNGLKPGDRVAGFVHGCNPSNHENGAFAEYITAKGDLPLKIPPSMSFTDAATMGAGVFTVAQGLYQSLALALPKLTDRNEYVFVYGGSSATGSLAIQFAKLSGYKVVTASSAKHETWLQELGANHVVDYKSPTCAADIRRVTAGNLAYVFDTIATPETAIICSDAIGSDGGVYSALNPESKVSRQDVVSKNTVVFTALGEVFQFAGQDVPASLEDHEFAVAFIKKVQQLLDDGDFKPHPASLQAGGLDGITDGLDKLRQGNVSGVKLVYAVSSD
ncbi:hypothetical protein Golomagni_06317 [Golovinomyces magnicellulatus]|nr:hypothetical protein Golomagni_06317 [Golovinomyces magnicellulatus]